MIITDITAAIDALDFYDRMYLGQFDEITKAYRYHLKKDTMPLKNRRRFC